MIPVSFKPEPPNFDSDVRQRGLRYLSKKGIELDKPLETVVEIPAFWRDCLDELYTSYEHICAYLCIYLERVTGDTSVDHCLPKSQRVDLAYEWSNYRLACMRMNAYKREFDDVLDPFTIQNGWFKLELFSGRIYPNTDLPDDIKAKVEDTIKRLRLDNGEVRELRARRFSEYIAGEITSGYLKKVAPFIWYEADRQGLL